MPGGPNYLELKNLLKDNKLHTVCEEAHCPNIGSCWERRTATFMILGDICTRACAYCAVTSGKPGILDLEEPVRLAETAQLMGLKYAVITSVNRDELSDGGSGIWASTVNEIREVNPNCTIEVLIPDMKNEDGPLTKIFSSKPEILGHNMETVERLYDEVRPQARYEWSLDVLSKSKSFGLC